MLSSLFPQGRVSVLLCLFLCSTLVAPAPLIFPAGSALALSLGGGLVVTGPAAAGATGATLLSVPTWGLLLGKKALIIKELLKQDLFRRWQENNEKEEHKRT